MLFVGDDWAEDHHDVYLMNETGDRLASRRLPEGLAGIRRLHELIAEHAEDPGQVVIGIETDRGLWVDALDRGRVSGVRDQPAGGGPLPRPPPRLGSQVRCLATPSCWPTWCAPTGTTTARSPGTAQTAEAIKVLARAHQNLIWARTRHTNASALARCGSTTPRRWRRSTIWPTATRWPSWAAPRPPPTPRG